MGILHFLNVKQGDCTIIQHSTGRITMVDVNNASLDFKEHNNDALLKAITESTPITSGNFGQKLYPVNPIAYMKEHGMDHIFRFILTHPDMDHMGGIKGLFAAFTPYNFWDTANTAEKSGFGGNCPYDEKDWLHYKAIRDGNPSDSPKRLVLYSGARGAYYNEGDGTSGQDGLYVLAPTPELIAQANKTEDPNDGGYVILYRTAAGRILIAGDSHDATWDYILANHKGDVTGVEMLLAPHHGRDSGRSFNFLDVVKPKMTLFGNANSDHLAYNEWSKRGLQIITNNQANCVVIDGNGADMQVYVTNKAFAVSREANTFYSAPHRAWYLTTIAGAARVAAE